MKLLTIICAIQLAAIILLFTKLVGIERTLETSAADRAPAPSIETFPAGGVSTPAELQPNEDVLRQIIRQELALYADADSQSSPTARDNVALDPVELHAQRESITERIEYFASVGSISNSDMQKLQTDIAKLDAAGRTEMLRELTRALNSGRLNGQL